MNTDLLNVATASSELPQKGLDDPDLAALEAALVRALASSEAGRGSVAAQGLARALRRCLSTDGRLLDFCQLHGGRRDLPGALPVGAWHALQACAKAINAEGISQVVFPGEAAGMPLAAAIEGLNALPALARVQLPAPPRGDEIDLSKLHSRGRQPLVLLSGRTDGVKVTAPLGLHVQAVSQEVAAAKSVVSYVDLHDTAVGNPRTVPGVIYSRDEFDDSVPANHLRSAGPAAAASAVGRSALSAPPSGRDGHDRGRTEALGGTSERAHDRVSERIDERSAEKMVERMVEKMVEKGAEAERGTGHEGVQESASENAPGAPDSGDRSHSGTSSPGGRPAPSKFGDPAVRAACRQLAIQWLHDRWTHHRAKAEAQLQMSETGGAGRIARVLGAQPPALPQRAYEQMRHKGAHAIFDASQFGNMIRHELQTMKPGDVRHFAVGTDRHLLGLEIHIKVGRHGHESRDEYIVNLFDPSDAATHKRVVTDTADWFRGRGLDAWGEMASHFESNRRIGALFRWPPAEAGEAAGRRAGVQIHVAGVHLASLEFLRHALGEGAVRGVAAFARQVFESSESAGPVCQRLLRGGASSGLARAMQLGRADAIAQWSDAVLRAPADVFTSDQRFGLLASDAVGRHPARVAHPLVSAFLHGQYRAVAAFTEAVARARANVLAPSQHLALLMAPDTFGRPVLHALSDPDTWRRTRLSADPELATRQQKAVYRYLHAVASSEMPDALKRKICSSSFRRRGLAALLSGSTAAKAAIDSGHAGLAGAMACAILDAGGTPQSTAELLNHLGVPMESLLQALARSGSRAMPWLVRIVQGLDHSGLRPREIGALKERYRWVRKEAQTLDVRLSPAAMPSSPDDLSPLAGATEHEPA